MKTLTVILLNFSQKIDRNSYIYLFTSTLYCEMLQITETKCNNVRHIDN